MKRLILLFFLLPSQVFAFVYPPKYVYEGFLRNNKQVHSITYTKVYQSISEGRSAQVDRVEKVFIERPGKVRVFDEKNMVDKRMNPTKAILMQQNQKREISIDSIMSPIEMLWAYDQVDPLMIRINQFQTPTHKYQWFLYQGKKHWMQGTRDGDFILFTEDTFNLKAAKKGDFIYQFQYPADSTSISSFPNRIIVFKNQKPFEEILIQNVQFNTRIPSEYFSTS